jgi:hypothetical protein
VNDQQHIIRRQNLSVNAITDDGFALKRRIEVLMQEIPAKLNGLFNELVNEHEWLQLDQLNIAIDGISEQHLEEQLTQRIVQEVKEKIIQQKQEALTGSFNSNTNFKITGSHKKTINAFYYFLENGMLPWWFELKSHDDFEKELMLAFERQEQEMNSGQLTNVTTGLKLLLQQTAARHRLLGQFSEVVLAGVLKQLLDTISSDFYKSLMATFEQLDKLKETASSERSLNKAQLKRIKAIVLEQCISWQFSESTATKLVLRILHEIEKMENVQLRAELLKTELFVRYYRPGSQSDFSEIIKKQKIGEPEQVESTEKKEVNDTSTVQKKTIAQQLIITEGALVTNAGLVILSPFLPELFKRCALLEDNILIDPAKAIAMMHFLVHGHCDYREYDVLLNKVLCNWDENKDIELVDAFSEFELTEMESLLETVVSYWTALKGTTAAGLREGFLCRQGKLMLKQDEWFLQVEKKTHDILLQQLPWTIGMVKLPWMEKMLRTEWV